MIEVAPAGTGMALSFAKITHIGGRQSNQDALGNALQDDLACFVVADGAGGHDGGEVASSIAVQAVLDSFLQESSFGARAMRSYIDSAIERVASAKTTQARLKDMSTTVTAVMIDLKNSCALWAHLGDTRAYLFRRGKVQQITKDHSLAQQFVDAGFWTYDRIRSHPQRNMLFAAIGSEGDAVPEVTQEAIEVLDGDVFLICSDGFWEWVTEDEMEQSLALATSAEEWLHGMCGIAEKSGSDSPKSRDNYTAFAIWLGEPEAVTIRR